VAIPGIIQEFNTENQTATVQPTIKEQINGSWIQLPLLLDVPVQFPRAGGYSVTFPVKRGDECIVIFNDMCIDSWWQSGDVQTQLEKRRHDLSDAVAILGITSVPKAIRDFSTESMQIRNDTADTVINIKDGEITIKAGTVNIGSKNFNITGEMDLTGDLHLTGYLIADKYIKSPKAVIGNLIFAKPECQPVELAEKSSKQSLPDFSSKFNMNCC